jgi:hypothetical protein
MEILNALEYMATNDRRISEKWTEKMRKQEVRGLAF